MSFENSLLETFNNVLEHGDFGSPDNEFLAPIFDQEPGSPAECNVGINFTSPLGEHSRDGEAGPGCSGSREPSKIEPTEKNVVAKVEKKKRKSWGQELRIPTTNLPPHKRAKTDEEKEQRRIERILRNRAAARSSRERKEKQVEALEEERRGLAESNARMRARLTEMEESNMLLRQQLSAMEKVVKRYEEQVGSMTCVVTKSSIVRPAHQHSPTSFWGAPEPSVSEAEPVLRFLDAIEEPIPTTVDPSVLGGPIGPPWGETVICSGYII
ncbi:hypothetical protein HOY82DRAFT_647208 [Tuber indicum]|nr:hypothetical protein HOY82DRAFT_647208 [Tuber indicum]